MCVCVCVCVFVTFKNHPGLTTKYLHTSVLSTKRGQFPWSQGNTPQKSILKEKYRKMDPDRSAERDINIKTGQKQKSLEPSAPLCTLCEANIEPKTKLDTSLPPAPGGMHARPYIEYLYTAEV